MLCSVVLRQLALFSFAFSTLLAANGQPIDDPSLQQPPATQQVAKPVQPLGKAAVLRAAQGISSELSNVHHGNGKDVDNHAGEWRLDLKQTRFLPVREWTTDDVVTVTITRFEPRVTFDIRNEEPTPVRMLPDDGIIEVGRSVDIVFTEHTDRARIHCTLKKKRGAVQFTIEPQLDIGRANPVPFTEKRLTRLQRAANGRARRARAQIDTAQNALARYNYHISSLTTGDLGRVHRATHWQRVVGLQAKIMQANQMLVSAQASSKELDRVSTLAGALHDQLTINYVVKFTSAPKHDRQPDANGVSRFRD